MPESKQHAQARADEALQKIFTDRTAVEDGFAPLDNTVKIPNIFLPPITGGTPEAVTIPVISGAILSGHRVVYIDNGSAFYFDPTNSSHWGKQLAFTTGASIALATTAVIIDGAINWSAAPLTVNKIYYAVPGGISITPPSTGMLQKVGTSIATNKLIVDFDLSIIL